MLLRNIAVGMPLHLLAGKSLQVVCKGEKQVKYH